jgi:SAM-dependent methyltransferase
MLDNYAVHAGARTVNDVIREAVAGRTFADVGGLWGTVNEKVTVAHLAGAAACSMIDAQPGGTDAWENFDRHAERLGVTGYQSVVADINDPDLVARVGCFDVVYCSGVVYHCPDPYTALRHLRDLARERLIVGSMTVPERIENERGLLDFSGGRVVAVPALDDASRAIMAAHFAASGIRVHNINTPESHDWARGDGTPNYAPWWWLWHWRTLAAMAEAVGLDVEEVIEGWEGRAHALVCRPRRRG